jgi:hypothetical protein
LINFWALKWPYTILQHVVPNDIALITSEGILAFYYLEKAFIFVLHRESQANQEAQMSCDNCFHKAPWDLQVM